MKKLTGIIIFLGMLAISLFISHSDVISFVRPTPAQKGFMDLSKWDFPRYGTVNLDGEWELYDNQLLFPEDFSGKGHVKPQITGYVKLTAPLYEDKNNKLIKPEGVRTYRLVVKIRPSNRIFGLKIENIRMSNRLYVNGVMLGSSGNPAEKNGGYYAGMTPYDTYFNINGERAEIIIQTANFGYPLRGTLYKICFGLQKNITFMTITNSSIELSGTIFMFLLAVYILYIYSTLKKEKLYLYYGITVLTLVVALLFNGEKILVQLLPFLSFEASCKIQQISIVLIATSLFAVLKELDNKIFPEPINKITNFLFWFYIFIVLTTGYSVYLALNLIT